MATTNTCKKCGCEDSFMPSPAPCPTPQGCPNPEPCSEVIDAQCVIYTGENIICDTDIVVTTNNTVAEAIENVVDYFCTNGGGGTGPQGPQGEQGVAGPTGPQGIPGSTGGAGTTGATGPQGIQGVAGPIGPAGLNWQGVWSASGVYAADDAVGFGGASWFCINPTGPNVLSPDLDPTNWALLASEGATGPAGPTGAAGVAGAAGATGPQGPAGSIGLTGAQGIQGIQGLTGLTGPAGTNGTNGINGTNGATGATGAQGPQGIQGPIGPAGGVTQIIAGTNITISPVGGTGAVTINSSGGGGSQFTYEIGQYVSSEGGVIMHRWLSNSPLGAPTAGTVQNYLVVALTDVGGTYIWGATGVTYGASSMFNGQLNTSLIAASSPTSAASACDALVSGGKSDWYLPATDEWRILFDNRWAVNQSLITFGLQIGIALYFTSTETSSNNALAFQTIFGGATDGAKVNTYEARAVRRFSI
tara:strand:+ start:1130 stop:2551 length:1422 start_codon:yes stop_codon:yes gene_type:complete